VRRHAGSDFSYVGQSRRRKRTGESHGVRQRDAGAGKRVEWHTNQPAELVGLRHRFLPSVKKAAFIVGSSYGRGVMNCRSGAEFKGSWSAPTMMQSTGGSFGLQAGGQATDFVVL